MFLAWFFGQDITGCGQIFFKKNLELHISSSDAALKNEILVADGIDLPSFGEKGVDRCYYL